MIYVTSIPVIFLTIPAAMVMWRVYDLLMAKTAEAEQITRKLRLANDRYAAETANVSPKRERG